MRAVIPLLLTLVLAAGCSHGTPSQRSAAPPSPSRFRVALLTSGPISDAGWNAAAYEGLELIKTRMGAETAQVQTTSPADFADAFRDFGARHFNLIFAHGFEYTDAALKAGSQFPATTIIISSGNRSSANVASLNFKFEDATYAEGVLAGLMTKTGVIGAVGGVELPAVRLTFQAYKLGFQSVRPQGKVLVSYIGNFNDVGAAKEAALAQIGQGADLLTHNADAAGVGVLQAAEQRHVLAFGAFGDQSPVAPEAVLASAVCDIPAAFLKIATEVKAGTFHPAIVNFGMKDGMVSLVFNPMLEPLIPSAAMDRLKQVEDRLIAGQIKLPSLENPG